MAYRSCLALVCWWCLCTASTAAPQPQSSAMQWQQVLEQLEAQKNASDELKANNKDLQDRVKSQESALLEAQRKTVDWWFSAIGVGLTLIGAVVAVGGVLLPLYWQRSERSRLKEAQAEFERMKQAADQALQSLQTHEQTGKESLEKIKNAQERAKKFHSGQVRDGANHEDEMTSNAEMQQAVRVLANASPIDKLRAQAIKASQGEKQDEEQAKRAYDLWHALAVIDPGDENAHFNAGYWAQELYRQVESRRKVYWIEAAREHYKRALHIKGDMHGAANNWGNALNAEAIELAKTDLSEARRLWADSYEKYAQALRMNMDDHEVVNNWANACSNEFHALYDSGESTHAEDILKKATSLLESHLAKYPNAAPELAYNLACLYSLSARAQDAVTQLELSRKAGNLPSHWLEDKDLNVIRTSSEYVQWAVANFPEHLSKDKNK